MDDKLLEIEALLADCEKKAKQCDEDGDGESQAASQGLYGEASAYRDVARSLRKILGKPPICDQCCLRLAVCCVTYDGHLFNACDQCCDHDEEMGCCKLTA